MIDSSSLYAKDVRSEGDVGRLFIIAAPSGGGKTSLIHQLIQDLSDIEVSISHTTRPMRPGEEDGVDYFFVDENAFQSMIDDGAFIEHARVFDYSYGTSMAQITERLRAGIDVVLDIDWQGARQIKQLFHDARSVFIIPPSMDALRVRLMKRRQDNDDIINNRMKRAQDELSHYSEFDYLIVNDEFSKAALDLRAIVIAERLSLARQTVSLRKLLSFLLTSK